MKKLLVLALPLLVAGGTTRAGIVAVTFDPQGTQTEAAVPPFSLFSLYIIGLEIGEVMGWELAMVPPPTVTVSTRTIYNWDGLELDADNYILGLGGCYGAPGENYIFARYDLVYLLAPPADDPFCIAVPDGGGTEAGFLAYVSCTNEVVEMCAGVDGCNAFFPGCAIMNPTSPCVVVKRRSFCQEPLAIQPNSWSALKAAF